MTYELSLDKSELNLLQVSLDHMEEHLQALLDEDAETVADAIHRLSICIALKEQLKRLNKVNLK